MSPTTLASSPARHGVLLASLPISAARYPSMALAILKPAIVRAGFRCDVRYFSLDYMNEDGQETFACLSDMRYYSALVGEWVFALAAEGESEDLNAADDPLEYISDAFGPKCPQDQLISRVLAILAARQG